MIKDKKIARQFISNILEQQYAKAQDQLQLMINEKVIQRIRTAIRTANSVSKKVK
jgi:hypothetical protein